MKDNTIGKTLRYIGFATIFVGGFASLIISTSVDKEFPVTLIVGGLASFISGMCFVGFSEIICLLQVIVNKLNSNNNNNNNNNSINKCQICGHKFEGSEKFCPKCGIER